MSAVPRRSRLLPLVAGAHACSLLALLGFAAMTGASLRAPLAWPGAAGMPLAWLFNLLAWIAPGSVLAIVALRLRSALLDAGLLAGIALRLLLIAALAVAAQGLLPLDPHALDAGASRWHAAAWMLWNLAFAASALLAACVLPRVRWPSLLAFAIVATALLAPALPWRGVLGAGVAERLVLACWWGWTLLLAWRLPRVAATRLRSVRRDDDR